MRTFVLVMTVLAGCGAATVPRESLEARLRDLEAIEPNVRQIEQGGLEDVRVFFAHVDWFANDTRSSQTGSSYESRLRQLRTRYWIAAANVMDATRLSELLFLAPAVEPRLWSALQARLEELAKLESENRPAVGKCVAASDAFGDDRRVNPSRTLIVRYASHVRCWVSHEVDVNELEVRIDGEAVVAESATTGHGSSGAQYVDLVIDMSRVRRAQVSENLATPRRISLVQRWSRTVKVERNYSRQYVARPAYTYLRLANGLLFDIPDSIVARQGEME